MQILARLVEEKVDIYKVIKRISCGINQSREESEDNKGESQASRRWDLKCFPGTTLDV